MNSQDNGIFQYGILFPFESILRDELYLMGIGEFRDELGKLTPATNANKYHRAMWQSRIISNLNHLTITIDELIRDYPL